MQSRCDFRLHQSYSVHLEIVWTLPHPAKVILFHVAEIRPILQITALINQQSALVVNGTSQNQIPRIFSTPYLWVTGVGLVANGFFCNGWNDGLFSFDIIEGHAIIRRNHHLCSEKLVVSTLINIFWIFLQIIDTRKIANTVGVDAPVERQFNEVLVTEAQPKMFDIMIGVAGGEFYGHQSEHGSFVLGGNSGLQAFTSNNDNFVTNSLTAPCISRGIIKYFPILDKVKVVRTWSGWYDQCIDVLPVIDNVKEVPGLTVAFGFSGHGFGISPAVSIALSELILNGKSTTIDISQLNYDRFKAKG